MASTDQLRTWWDDYKCRANPDEWTLMQFFHVTVPVPKVALDAYRALEQVLRATGYNPSGADTGTYVCRPIDWDPDNDYSLHSYGIAIDFDWFENPDGPAGSDPFSGELTIEQIDAIYSIKNTHGIRLWTWGGWWNRRDRMHFQLDVPPDRCVVDWNTVKEDEMALPKEVEDFVVDMFNGAKQVQGTPNGYFTNPVIAFIKSMREDPVARKSDLENIDVGVALPREAKATIVFEGGE